MGHTIAEKILAAHCERSEVRPGEYHWCRVDAAPGLPVQTLKRLNITHLNDPARTFFVDDHLAPPPTVERADLMVEARKMVRELGVEHFFEYGRHGIIHQVYAENGVFAPGELVAMRDSHATSGGVFNACVTSVNADLAFAHIFGVNWFWVPPSIRVELVGRWPGQRGLIVGKDVVLRLLQLFGTDFALYRSLEVTGPAVRYMTLSSRWTIANMGVELGAKFCLFEYDEVVAEYLEKRIDRDFTPVYADADAVYERAVRVDLTDLAPMVSCPGDPGNVASISEVEAQRVPVDQAFIGSCTNGRLEDYALAARILRGRTVHPRVRLLCSPASQAVWREVLEAGLWSVFADAGANIEHSTCGPCFGGHLGVMGAGEVSISSTNRNFPGRQGSPEAFVYLANPAVVAASAVTGYISDPRNLVDPDIHV